MDRKAKQKQGKRNRRFGHDAEREWARDLTKATGHKAERITSEPRHGNLGDVIFFPDSDSWKFQVRSGLQPGIWKAVRDIDAAVIGSYHIPAVLLNKSNGPGMSRDRLVVMRAEYFLDLLKRAYPEED